MGKRELGLIAAFIVVGVLVWQVTAPKAEGPGFSFRGWLSEVRREMRGRNASAEVTTNPVIPIKATTVELRVPLSTEVIIKGEDRADIAAELKVTSNGFDEAEAKKLAGEVKIQPSDFADSVVLKWSFPHEARQVVRLTLRVPSRLRIQIEGNGTGDVSGVHEVLLARPRGTVKISNIAGTVRGESRISRLTLDGASAFDVVAIGGENNVRGIKGDFRMNLRDSELRLDKPAGKVTITSTESRVRVDAPASDLRVETVAGHLDVTDVQHPLEIDGRDSRITIAWTRPSASKIQHADGRVDMTLPKEAAYNLDVRTTKGDLHPPASMTVTDDGNESTLTKSAGANAPSIFIRGTRTGITIR